MKMISKIAGAALALTVVGHTASAQSLADAKKAIDAEQYQKAKSILKNLVNTQSTKDENFFYLGWVYVEQDYADSAKAVFNRGIAANPASALNYVGLGAVARLAKDNSGAQQNFDKAIGLAKKDSKPYIYIGESYLLDPANANAAIAALQKGIAANAKDADLYVSLGNAYRSQLKSNDAYKAYSQALAIDPKSAKANVATGVLWKYANNFEDAETQFKAALATDANFGPAYREWAETDLRWAKNVPAQASAKVKEAAEHYRQFLDLTDRSPESQLRYADFLYQAGDYKTLEQTANTLSANPNANLRTYRYLAYAKYENGDYAGAQTALNTFMSKAGTRVIPYDYYYLGRIQSKQNQTAEAVKNLEKAASMDSTLADAYGDVAKTYYADKQYEKAGDAYHNYLTKSHNAKLTDYFNEGASYYYAYQDQYYSTAKPKPTPDATLLTKADSAFSYVNAKLPAPNAAATLYRARVNDLKETSRDNINGYAKPFYEQYIQLTTAKGAVADADKKPLAEAYAYLGNYYQFKEKDAAKATENFTKARELDPTNRSVQSFFSKKPAAGK
jgi:tetratricopeptide (TPR) repeat protein